MITTQPPVSRGPVFIVGMNGSGTTMMLDHLSHHPELYGFKLETYILPDYVLNVDKYGDLHHDKNFRRLWNDMRGEYPFRRMNKGRPVDLPADWTEVGRDAAKVFDRIMRVFAEKDGKSRWCEKTPMYALHISTLSESFPGACFIHMIRDGRACAASNKRRWGRHPAYTVFRWKRVVGEARRQGAKLRARYLEVRYEDLTESPDQYMRAVCNFVGVAFHENVLLASRPRTRMPGVESATIVTNQDRNSSYLSASSLASLEKIAGKQLASLGYDNRYPEGDVDPPAGRVLWWFVRDALAVFVRQFIGKMTFQRHMTWSLFIGRLSATIRNAQHSAFVAVKARRNRR